MKLQIKVIRFVSIMSIVLAIGTYLITLNMENGFISLSTPWFSHNFVLTVCGGAFASMLVVLLCEIQKYFEIKHVVEDEIFKHSYRVYTQLIILKGQIQQLLANPDCIVPKDILSHTTTTLKEEVDALSRIEYCTFSKRVKLISILSAFCETTARDIIKYTIYETYLAIAINTDQINHLEKHGETTGITARFPTTNSILKKYDGMVNSYISKTIDYLQAIDDSCGKRFKWGFIKHAVDFGVENSSFMDFDEFVK